MRPRSGESRDEKADPGIAGCCARAASGHAAAAPPSSVMNSRRLTRSPRRRGQAASAGWSRPSAFAVFRLMHELEFCRLHDRQIGGLVALENAASVDADQAIRVEQIHAITHQSTGLEGRREGIDCRQSVAGCQLSELCRALRRKTRRLPRAARGSGFAQWLRR